MKFKIVLFLFLSLAFISCENKLEQVKVGEMSEYRDPAFGFKMKYPKEWLQLGAAGKALFCKSLEVANKFLDPRTGEPGAQVIVEVLKYDGKKVDELIQSNKDEMKQTYSTLSLSPDEQITVGGKQSTKVPYTIKVTSKTNIYGYEIFVPGDTALYRLDFSGYGDYYAAHSAVYDAMMNSFELPVIVEKKSNIWQASGNLETYKSDFFTMQYPDNLNFVNTNKGKNDFIMEMRADRLDCSIHIDVFGAQKLTTEKVWEQNKGKYKAKATGETTIDGNKAFWVDYSLMANINSRAYFVVKNDKVIRMSVNWFAPQKDAYFPAFEKCVNSIIFK